ncbi:hypothetical protein B0H14DRAFT_3132891 [Mycena olivaceomarginata]|nr:hypothetical protein B0H14DRAFT_3132891 [Mycena olivaceomarginata]
MEDIFFEYPNKTVLDLSLSRPSVEYLAAIVRRALPIFETHFKNYYKVPKSPLLAQFISTLYGLSKLLPDELALELNRLILPDSHATNNQLPINFELPTFPSLPRNTLSTFEPGDLVLGKIRGHTAWPGIVGQVVDPDVLRKSSIGGVRRGKYYAVGTSAWLSPNNISKVDREWLEKAMNNPATQRTAILAGYKEALDYALSNTQNGSTRTMKKTGSAESSSATSKSEFPGEDGHAFQFLSLRRVRSGSYGISVDGRTKDIAKADAKLNAIEGFSAMSLYFCYRVQILIRRHGHKRIHPLLAALRMATKLGGRALVGSLILDVVAQIRSDSEPKPAGECAKTDRETSAAPDRRLHRMAQVQCESISSAHRASQVLRVSCVLREDKIYCSFLNRTRDWAGIREDMRVAWRCNLGGEWYPRNWRRGERDQKYRE